jgi:halogenation protein CepH
MTAGPEEYDVLVIGGGPGGSAIAGYLAPYGVRVLIVEGKRFPRAHIGESLLAVSTPLLDDLGVLPAIEAAGFLRKLGSMFVWGPTSEPMTLEMPAPGYAYQVRRPEFDTLLLDHAVARGATVRQEHWVKDPLWDADGRMCGAMVATAGGEPRPVHARFVIDASGLFQFLPRRLGLPIETFGPRRVALTSYHGGALRLPAPHTNDIISEACRDGWIWFIPLDEETTSVGFVGDQDDLDEPADVALARQIAGSTLVRDLLAPATVTGPAKTLKYTNHMVTAPLWADGHILVGDTAIFVDPLFSTGVHGTLYSASCAAAGIVSVLAGELAEDDVAAWYDERFRTHYRQVRETIRLLYGLHPEDSRFWRRRDLSQITEEEAERLVRDIGVARSDFFVRTSATGALDLPGPLRDRIGDRPYRLRPRALPPDTVLTLGPDVELVPGLIRAEGRLTPSRVLRHRYARTQQIEFPRGGFLDRLTGALDGRRDLASAVRLACRDEVDPRKAAAVAGSLLDGRLLAAANEIERAVV